MEADGQMEECTLDAANPVRRLIDIIGSRWALLVLYSLEAGNKRHGELVRSLPDISKKMLTQTLRQLETAGFVSRTVFAEVPSRVEYRLTPLGESLAPITDALCDWSRHYGDAIPARATSA